MAARSGNIIQNTFIKANYKRKMMNEVREQWRIRSIVFRIDFCDLRKSGRYQRWRSYLLYLENKSRYYGLTFILIQISVILRVMTMDILQIMIRRFDERITVDSGLTMRTNPSAKTKNMKSVLENSRC